MASFIYNSCLWDAFNAKINFAEDTFKVVFLTDEYEPQKDAHATRADLAGEANGRGYTLGGMPVAVRAQMLNDKLHLSLGAVTLAHATVTARYAVYCVDRGEAEDDRLVACVDFGGPVTSTNGDFALTASSLRIMN